MISRLWTRLVVLCATLLMMGLAATPASAAAAYEIIQGTILPQGQVWKVATPVPISNWNGTLILDLDAASMIPNNTIFKWLIDHGYAYGGTNRDTGGIRYDIKAGELIIVRQEFIDHYGRTPSRTIAYGGSRGSNVARHAVELYPEIFVGGGSRFGGGNGLMQSMNTRLDSQFALKTLINPASPLKLVNVANTAAAIAAETAALSDLITLADSTPRGRARFALAAAFSQTPGWIIPNSARPASDDYDAQYAQLKAGFLGIGAQAISFQAGGDEQAGGNTVWNNGVDYRVELARSGRQDFVHAMYHKAGLTLGDLEDDLVTLKVQPRISADPVVVARAEKWWAYTGKIPGPFHSVDNISDTNYPAPTEVAYEQTVRKAGNGALHQTAWVESAGHGNINNLEAVVGIVTLIDRLDTGKWHYKTAAEQTALANKILSETDIPLGVPRFIDFKPDQPLRPWDVSDFDTYQP